MAHWDPEVNIVFLDALDINDPTERRRYLDQKCHGNGNLRSHVERLLAANERAGDFLETPPTDVFEAVEKIAVHEFSSAGLGSVIGSYRLLEEIGEGGFGTVFLAEQREPVQRLVALKIIKPGMDTRQVITRFEAERQALAMMDHPNICRVLDCGATDAQSPLGTGRPYFVMELVKGVPITRHCDEGQLGTRERLALFSDVCHAVQHAHQKGVIHRDLKPSNILVTCIDAEGSASDRRGLPKIIDFGIAKAVEGRLTDKTLFTEQRQMLGTPAYMSPEQAGLADLDIDTRSDIYALGVLLYELLTGTTPFDADSLRNAGYDDMRRIIREVEPPKPSTRLSSMSSLPQSPASARPTDSQSLGRLLRGDLDWIVMKCLEKDRTRRYETASALAADVQRHLTGEPVVAAPPSRLYRLSKTFRRHRTAAAVAASFVVLVGGGFVATSTLWRQAAHARDAESDQRARAEAINTFLKEMLTAAKPAKTKGEKLTVREALDEAARRIDDGALGSQSLVEAEVRATIGETYFALGLYPQAEAHLLAAERIQARELGDDHTDVLRMRSRLAQTYAWDGDHSRAIELARPTLEMQRRVLGPEHPETLRTLSFLGNAMMLSAEYLGESEQILEEALAGQTRQLGREHEDTIETLLYLAWAHSEHSEDCLPLSQEALELATRMLGPDHPHTCTAMLTLALAYRWVGQWTEAQAWLARALETTRRVFGEEHHRTADCLADTASCQMHFGEYAEAVKSARQSMEIARRTYGPGKKWTIRYTRGFATALTAANRDGEALQVLKDGLAEARRVLGDEDFETLNIQIGYANALSRFGRHAESLEYCTHGFEIALRKAGAAHKWTRDFGRARASNLWTLGRRDEARAFLLANLNACRAARGDRAAQTLVELNLCAQFLRARGRVAEAEPLAREALEGYRTVDPNFRRRLGDPANTLARCLEQLDRPREALELAVESASYPNANANHLNYAGWLLLTSSEEELRNPALALQFALKANELTGYEKPHHLDTLALAYHRTGDPEKAIEIQRKALSLLEADAPDRAEYEDRLREFQAASESAVEGREK